MDRVKKLIGKGGSSPRLRTSASFPVLSTLVENDATGGGSKGEGKLGQPPPHPTTQSKVISHCLVLYFAHRPTLTFEVLE